MILLSDNDIWLKFAQMNLLDEALDWLAPGNATVFVLPTLRFWLRLNRPEAALQRHGPEVVDRLKRGLLRTRELAEVPSADVVAQFVDHQGIDNGELLLFAALATQTTTILATGDKRSIVAFGSATDLAPLAARCAGRIVCLEQIADGLLASEHCETVLARMYVARHVDGAIRRAVGDGACRTVAQARAELQQYVQRLRNDARGLLR